MAESGLVWLRAEWLWGFLPLALAVFLWVRQGNNGNAWDGVVDAELQPYVIEGRQQKRSWYPWALFMAWALTLLLLAGPVWTQQEVPVFEADQAEVVVFDLSRSMRADDILPDRLTRARFKMTDLLNRSEGRQTALIAFTERPYVISPLTEDSATVQAFIPSLEPGIMPVQGSRPDLAIDHAVTLLNQAGIGQGHIILITDATISEQDRAAAASARQAGHRVSVLAVGTAAGAPLRDEQGQFIKTAGGAVVVPQVSMVQMHSLADAGGGVAVSLSSGSEDLDALDGIRSGIAINDDGQGPANQRIYWVEYAPWLVWLLVPLLLLAFRRGLAL